MKQSCLGSVGIGWFWGSGGDVLIGEVSTVNDDETDNIFSEPIGRLAQIDEDMAPTHLLVSDYAGTVRLNSVEASRVYL